MRLITLLLLRRKIIPSQSATEPLDGKGRFKNEIITAHRGGELVRVKPEEVDYIDISPSQILGLSGSLIPFLEHNDPTQGIDGCKHATSGSSPFKARSSPSWYRNRNIIAGALVRQCIAEEDGVIGALINRREDDNGKKELLSKPIKKF